MKKAEKPSVKNLERLTRNLSAMQLLDINKMMRIRGGDGDNPIIPPPPPPLP